MHARTRPFAVAMLVVAALPAQKSLEQLVDELAGTDAARRSQAYGELVRRREPELVGLLGKRIDAMPSDGQQFALYLLQQQPIDGTHALYTRLLASDRPKLRVGAAAMLARSGEKDRVPVLCKALGELALDERSSVLTFLYAIEDARLGDSLRGWLAATAPLHLVTSVLEHLERVEKGRSPATLAAVRTFAAGKDGRLAALAWLAAEADGEAAAEELAQALTAEPQKFWQIDRLFDRARKYPKVLAPVFEQALRTARSQYDVGQLVALVRSHAPEAVVPALRTLFAEGSESAKKGALAELAALPGGLEGKDLQAMLAGRDPEQQLAAAEVLRRRDDPSGLATVLALAKEAGKHRAEAARVLGGFRDRSVVPVLLDCLEDSNLMARQNAWTALQSLLRDLFPYRRFDFAKCGYEPNGGNRAAGVLALRAWWQSVQ
ncbi:MAG: HEAT repeat domain-containing protein [Planctomycetes bacterium]|nr:HEAT repeat domain-containing protein [Planctomycetota bacterium]